MNIANLQLEGLYIAVASVNQALVQKGVLSQDEMDLALKRAEQIILGDYRLDDLSPAERDAAAFAPRVLALANLEAEDGTVPSFSDLARRVGETKGKHGDQI